MTVSFTVTTTTVAELIMLGGFVVACLKLVARRRPAGPPVILLADSPQLPLYRPHIPIDGRRQLAIEDGRTDPAATVPDRSSPSVRRTSE